MLLDMHEIVFISVLIVGWEYICLIRFYHYKHMYNGVLDTTFYFVFFFSRNGKN
jgi:hypothetical protein